MTIFKQGGERRLLWLLALTQFTIIMDFMVIMPLGPQIMQSFHIGPAAFATAVSAYSWCSGISGLFAATYIDRFDRHKLMLAVYALFALSNVVCAFADSFSLLLIARAFAGITGGVLGSVIMVIVSDVIPPERRGAASGTIMTAFSLAAVAGVPAGILLGAHAGWYAPFILLAALSVAIIVASLNIVPRLDQHLQRGQAPLREILPALWAVLSNPAHVNAFVLTFIVMTSHMLVIPFISPILVANHGVPPAQLGWMYMAGGAATFFTSRRVGKLADAYGKHKVFRIAALLSTLPVLFVTHLPHWPFVVLLVFFPFFMVAITARMIPMQALLTTVPAPQTRGAFLSANSAIQALGTGTGAWLGGLLLSGDAHGGIEGFGLNGWLSAATVILALLWVQRVKAGAIAPRPQLAAVEI